MLTAGVLWRYRTPSSETLIPVKLTKRTVDALVARTAHDHVFDSELVGFGVRVMPSGTKQFFVQYRPPDSRPRDRRRVTIGRYGQVTIDQARTEAKRMLALVTQGRDPAAERVERRAAPTVGELGPAFVDLVHAKRKATTATEYERQMKRHILPALEQKRMADVTRADVGALHLALRDRPYLANRVLALMGVFFEWAESQDYRPAYSNPARHVEPFPERKRDRYLSPAEFGRIGEALTRAERVGLPPAPRKRRKPADGKTAKHRPKNADTPIPANPFAIAAIRFLLLSGWREAEARTLRWAELDVARGLALLSDTKTGRSARSLGAPALALVAKLPRLQGSPYVFPGSDANKPIVNLSRLWDAVRHAADITDVRIHDLRHAFASVAVSGGLSLPIIGSLLGHRNTSTTQRYAHLAADPQRLAADLTASGIAAMLAGGVKEPAKKRRTPKR